MMAFGGIYKGKRVLVTGHTGFKGSWLVEWLHHLGAPVAGYSLSIPTTPSHFESIQLDKHLQPGCDFRGDIRDIAALEKAVHAFKPQVIFHLAAQPLVRDSYDSPKDTFDTNVGGTVNVLEVIRRTVGTANAVEAAVIIATDKCYENREWEFGYREVDALGGKDPYSGSKGAAEIAFASYVRSFFSQPGAPRLASARAGNVIGAGDWAKDRIIPDCVRSWERKQAVTIRSPHSTRPWQHVLEPLSGYLALGAALLRKESASIGESFNFGPGSDANCSVESLLTELRKTWKAAEWNVDASQLQGKAEAKLLRLVCDKAEARLRWWPTLSLAESVRMTSEGYQSKQPITLQQIEQYEALARERGRSWALQ